MYTVIVTNEEGKDYIWSEEEGRNHAIDLAKRLCTKSYNRTRVLDQDTGNKIIGFVNTKEKEIRIVKPEMDGVVR